MVHKLLELTGDPHSIPAMKPAALGAMSVAPETIAELTSTASLDAARTECESAAGGGIRIIDLEHEDYPSLLRETATPPLALYVRGNVWDPRRPHIALVGSRRASPYGINAAESLAEDLASSGLVVTSGLARGIDAAAHRGALNGGRTVAVFGTGLDRIYPPENAALADQIVANGAIISEFRLGTPPLRGHFPQRNRILAGMTLGTVVVEANERSGSLITARMALEANREVFAVPGPIQSRGSRGTHLLIRQGAALVSCWQDIVEELPGTVPGSADKPNDERLASSITAPQQSVLDALSAWKEMDIDMLLDGSDLSAGEVYAALFELELADRIRKLPGERYVKKR